MRLRLSQLHQSGAADGESPVWDDALGYFVPGSPTSGPPTGAAGGVLSGTYPNPGFAADMATQAELDAAIAGIAATATGELLMQDGVSSPPVPLETEDGTDWLYEG